MRDDHHEEQTYRASRILFEMAGVQTRRFHPPLESLTLTMFHHTAEVQNEETQPISPQDDATHRHRDLLKREANWDCVAEGVSKRRDYLTWEEYFMAMAFLTAKRSKDPNTQVGACLVNPQKRIVGLGYNGFPRGGSDDALPWARHADNRLHTKYPYVCHAEVNAVLNKCSASLQDAILYVAMFPCNECAKVIIQSGIQEVVYLHDPYHDTDPCRASRILFAMAGVKCRQLVPKIPQVHLHFKKF